MSAPHGHGARPEGAEGSTGLSGVRGSRLWLVPAGMSLGYLDHPPKDTRDLLDELTADSQDTYDQPAEETRFGGVVATVPITHDHRTTSDQEQA